MRMMRMKSNLLKMQVFRFLIKKKKEKTFFRFSECYNNGVVRRPLTMHSGLMFAWASRKLIPLLIELYIRNIRVSCSPKMFGLFCFLRMLNRMRKTSPHHGHNKGDV